VEIGEGAENADGALIVQRGSHPYEGDFGEIDETMAVNQRKAPGLGIFGERSVRAPG